MVDRGAVAALGPNQYTVGRQAGRMVAQILKGTKPGTISVEFPSQTELHINLDFAQKMELAIPQQIMKRAKRVVKTLKKD